MKHLVLDTEVFRRENLSFRSVRFQRLAELVEEGEVEIHITDVVEEEVRRAIIEQVRSGLEVLRQEPTRRALNVLAGGGVPKLRELLREIDESEIISNLNQEFNDLLTRLDAHIIPSDDVPTKEVRERYFKVTPPFGHRIDKKHEFPDAISIIAVEQWAAKQSDDVVVISGDRGVATAAKAIEGVQHISELRDLIDSLLRRLAVVGDPDALMDAKAAEIEERVRVHFEELGFFIEGEWGEVVEVTVLSVDLGRAYLADRKGDLVTLEFEANIRFEAELSFDDPDETAYDNETGETYVFGSLSRTVRDSTSLEGEVQITVDVDDISSSTIEILILPSPDIGVQPPAEPDYK